MTKTKVSCYKCWHCKRKTKVSSYVPLREKQKYPFTSLNWKSKTTNLSLITPDKRYFAVSVLWISENSQHSSHDYIPLWQKQKYHVTNVDIVKEKQKYQNNKLQVCNFYNNSKPTNERFLYCNSIVFNIWGSILYLYKKWLPPNLLRWDTFRICDLIGC